MRYHQLMRLWSLVFLCVGLSFIFFPEKLAESLTSAANQLGLSGTITMPRDNIGYVLALSLMAGITCLADLSVRQPNHSPFFAILMVCKITSTLGFLYLTIQSAPAWLLCAVGDGFVAWSIWFTFPKKKVL